VITKFAGTPVSTPQQLQLAVERAAIDQQHPIEVVRAGEKQELTYRGSKLPEAFGKTTAPQPTTPQPQPTELNAYGFEVSDLDPAVAQRLGMEGTAGVLVQSIERGSPAAAAGLQPGMVITRVDRQPVADVNAFEDALEARQGEGVMLLVRTEKGSRFVVVEPKS
jgi:S1-C subfamily serine protease